MDSALNPLIISVLRGKISEKFERIKRRHDVRNYDSDSEDEDEKALFTKTFKDRCYKCESLAIRQFNGRVKPIRGPGIQVRAEMVEQSTM